MKDGEVAHVQVLLAGGHKKGLTRRKDEEGTGAGCRMGGHKGTLPEKGTLEQRRDLTQVFQEPLTIFRTCSIIMGVAGTGQTYVQFPSP